MMSQSGFTEYVHIKSNSHCLATQGSKAKLAAMMFINFEFIPMKVKSAIGNWTYLSWRQECLGCCNQAISDSHWFHCISKIISYQVGLQTTISGETMHWSIRTTKIISVLSRRNVVAKEILILWENLHHTPLNQSHISMFHAKWALQVLVVKTQAT